MGFLELTLGITLSIASWTDWKKNKIYNSLLFPSFLLAITLNVLLYGFAGLKMSCSGAFVGFALLLIPYFMGGMGAGDVKLLTVIGAYFGPQFVVTAFLYGAILNGVICVILLIKRKALIATLKRFVQFLPVFRNMQNFSETLTNASREKIPYGIALCLGTVFAWIIPLRGLW